MSLPQVPQPKPGGGDQTPPPHLPELQALVGAIEQRAREYLKLRPDNDEQSDHLRHVADRTRWMYHTELLRTEPGRWAAISEHDDALIEACVFSHDIGKWIPRDDLRALLPEGDEAQRLVFEELTFSSHQVALFQLALRRRFELPQDGYTPEYDSAHHLVSAFLMVRDEPLGFHRLDPVDQARLIKMVLGHQFGSYFKESLLSVRVGREITTGMLMDVSRPDRMAGDTLACAFHDADISDLLFVGSLERRPFREDIYHAGGLVKILLINFINRINRVPRAPSDLEGCLRSCQATVRNACNEFITQTAIEHGFDWRKEASRFLETLRDQAVYDQINSVLQSDASAPSDRITTIRSLIRLRARIFLTDPAPNKAQTGDLHA